MIHHYIRCHSQDFKGRGSGGIRGDIGARGFRRCRKKLGERSREIGLSKGCMDVIWRVILCERLCSRSEKVNTWALGPQSIR